MTTQITKTKLDKLNILELYQHYDVLERSRPLLSADSLELVQAELEQCATLRSEKVDRLYYALASHEDALERIKKEKELIDDAKKHHESQLSQIKRLICWIRRALPLDSNRIQGKNYEFVLSRQRQLSVEIHSSVDDWTPEEQKKFCVVQTVTTTKHTVLTSIEGEVLEEKTEPKTKTEVIPNIDALRDAYTEGQAIPQGVRIEQNYSIRKNRLFSGKRVDSLPSDDYEGFLQQPEGT